MSEPTTPDRLDDLVNDRLGDVERAHLLEQVRTDAPLNEELALRTDAATAARRAAVRDHIRAAARDDAYRRRGGARIRTLSSGRGLAAAASVLLLVVAGVFLFRTAAASSPEALAAAYFEPDPGLPTTLGEAEDAAFDEAMIDYKLGDYPAALRQWGELRAEVGAGDTLSYFYGVTLLAAGRPVEAVTLLREVRGGGFVGEARWYEALALLAQGQEAAAKPLLERVAETDGAYAAQARELLGALE